MERQTVEKIDPSNGSPFMTMVLMEKKSIIGVSHMTNNDDQHIDDQHR